jgi:hypothetical protein
MYTGGVRTAVVANVANVGVAVLRPKSLGPSGSEKEEKERQLCQV